MADPANQIYETTATQIAVNQRALSNEEMQSFMLEKWAPNSVELKIDSKGGLCVAIKLYCEWDKLQEAVERACFHLDQVDERYPNRLAGGSLPQDERWKNE